MPAESEVPPSWKVRWSVGSIVWPLIVKMVVPVVGLVVPVVVGGTKVRRKVGMSSAGAAKSVVTLRLAAARMRSLYSSGRLVPVLPLVPGGKLPAVRALSRLPFAVAPPVVVVVVPLPIPVEPIETRSGGSGRGTTPEGGWVG